MKELDRRLNAVRTDLADARLEGRVAAERFVEGHPARVTAPVVDVHAAPRADAGIDTQFLAGDMVRVFEEREGWAWAQAETDGYVGYVAATALGAPDPAPTHVVVVPRTFAYPGPDLKLPIAAGHSMGAALRVEGETETRGTRYAVLASGEAMIASHLRPIGEHSRDYVSIVETFIHTPYLWGGTSGFGVDCSGLVQLAMRMTGRTVLRDTDMQEQSIGRPVTHDGLQRGDLVFWRGHVAILTDADTVIHANGASMTVACEPIRQALERIAPLFGQPTAYRRP